MSIHIVSILILTELTAEMIIIKTFINESAYQMYIFHKALDTTQINNNNKYGNKALIRYEVDESEYKKKLVGNKLHLQINDTRVFAVHKRQ